MKQVAVVYELDEKEKDLLINAIDLISFMWVTCKDERLETAHELLGDIIKHGVVKRFDKEEDK